MEVEKRFLEIYDENADSVFRLCYFKTSDREVAHDLVQDTFTKAWAYIADGKEVNNLRALIFTIARNLIKDYKKKKSLSFSDLSEYEQEESLATTSTIEASAEVTELLGQLDQISESDRELLQLRFVEDLSVEEMATIYNERPNTISVRIHRALGRFRKRFGSEVQENEK